MNIRDLGLLIFDWSGVISDDRLAVFAANLKILELHGRSIISFSSWLEKPQTLKEFLERNEIFYQERELAEVFRKSYNQIFNSGIRPYPYSDVKRTLNRLQELGKMMAVVSAHFKEAIKREMRIYGLKNYFSLVLSTGLETNKAQALKEVCRQLKIKEDQSAYIGDTIFDIRAAKEAGLHSFALSRGYHRRAWLEKEEPEILAPSLSKLLEELGAWE